MLPIAEYTRINSHTGAWAAVMLAAANTEHALCSPKDTACPPVKVHEWAGRCNHVYRDMQRSNNVTLHAPERLFGIAAARAIALWWARVLCSGLHWLGELR